MLLRNNPKKIWGNWLREANVRFSQLSVKICDFIAKYFRNLWGGGLQ